MIMAEMSAGRRNESGNPLDKFLSTSLAPANVNLALFDYECKDRERAEDRFIQSIEQVSSRFDYILIDCPSTLNLCSSIAIRLSDLVVIPSLLTVSPPFIWTQIWLKGEIFPNLSSRLPCRTLAKFSDSSRIPFGSLRSSWTSSLPLAILPSIGCVLRVLLNLLCCIFKLPVLASFSRAAVA